MLKRTSVASTDASSIASLDWGRASAIGYYFLTEHMANRLTLLGRYLRNDPAPSATKDKSTGFQVPTDQADACPWPRLNNQPDDRVLAQVELMPHDMSK